MGIIDPFEVVDVDHNDTEQFSFLDGQRVWAQEELLAASAIPEVGEGGDQNGFFGFLQFDGHLDLRSGKLGQFDFNLNHCCKILEVLDLMRTERSRLVIDDAESADRSAISSLDGMSGVEADAGVSRHQGVVVKSLVFGGVLDLEGFASMTA